MKRRLTFFLSLISLLPLNAQTLVPVGGDAESQQSLNGTWQFNFDDGRQGQIRVPGNWDMQGYGSPSYGTSHHVFNPNNPGHNAVYSRTFTVPDTWRGYQVWIAFDGVENGYTLIVNGDSIGSFHSAFNRAMFDISRAVKWGKENALTVKVTQADMPYWQFDTNDDWAFGGISRDVTLYAIPKNHISDLSVGYKVNGRNADVSLSMATPLKKHTWQIELKDADGNTVYANNLVNTDQLSFTLSNAHLWTAETPYLYTLRLSLLKGKKVEQTVVRRIGVREVSWQDGVFRINGVNVKLKGVNHHDESPVNGRAETEEEMLQDLRMMKAANINAIRTSHYPPSPHFMDMLDSLGFYAIDEVPYGFGDSLLVYPSTLLELKKRAWLTVQRDKLRPSVVIWSVGNENPLTENGLLTAHYVSRLDPTRPNLFPNTHKPFEEELALQDDSITMLSVHYPLASDLEAYLPQLRHPLVNTECAHALGLDFGLIESLVDEWYKHDQLAGGCVWLWADQGLLLKDRHINSRYETTQEVWPTQDSYYDMQDIRGTDGIVYPDRYPQVDYWQVREAFAPVVIAKGSDGRYTISNRYDFTNLNTLTCHVSHYNRAKLTKEFSATVDVAPRTTQSFNLLDRLPNDGYAQVAFTDRHGNELYRQSFVMGKETVDADSITIANPQKFSAEEVKQWIERSVRVRMGRKPTLSSVATIERDRSKKHNLWKKYELEPTAVELVPQGKGAKNMQFRVRFDGDEGRYVDGTLIIDQSKGSVVNVGYQLQAHGGGEVLETGLTLLTGMKSSDTRLSYMGMGPYACYPGRSKLSHYGSYTLWGDDIYFPGNRMAVSVAMLQEGTGEAMVLIPREGDNVSVERNSDGTINLNHCTQVMSVFNKNVWPESGTINADGLSFSGSFDLGIYKEGPGAYLRSFFPTGAPQLHQPYFNSYDQ